MALSTATHFEVRTGGSATNGGGFVKGQPGTDWSQQNAAQYAVTDGVTAGTTTITSATANFGADVVGNIMYVEGGTGSVSANWYFITARTDASTITVDRATGLTAGTAVTLNIGGALDSPGTFGRILSLNAVNAMHCYVASGTYTLSTSSSNVSGGVFSCVNYCYIVGYKAGSTRTDFTETPVIDTGVITAVSVFNITAISGICAYNLRVNGNSNAGVTGFILNASNGAIANCSTVNCPTGFNILTIGIRLLQCSAFGGTTGFSTASSNGGFVGCIAKSCTTRGFGGGSNSTTTFANCLAISCGIGFESGGGSIYVNCTAYGSTTDGYDSDVSGISHLNCVSTNNGGYGFDLGTIGSSVFNCAVLSNTSGNTNNGDILNFTILTASPYVDVAGLNFIPNSVAGGGQVLRNASTVANGAITYLDIGGAQHKDETKAGTFS